MEPGQRQRRLAAILSADVQGYSRLMGSDEEGTLRSLTACRDIFAGRIQAGQGRIVNTAGDAILAEFSSVVDAIAAAVGIQQDLAKRNEPIPPDRHMIFRIGINLGDVLVHGDDIFGDGVNIAARLQALADGGGVCISGSAYDQVESRSGLAFEDMGDQSVKNIAKPVRAYKVLMLGGAPAPKAKTVLSPKAAAKIGAPQSPSIAVLPFNNTSGDPEQAQFCDGLTEDLITDLTRIPRLTVTPRNTVLKYRGGEASIPQAAKDLGVRYVLEGNVRRSGGRVRLTAQLIDAQDNRPVWGERFDREFGDIFELQDDLVRVIGSALEVQMLEGDQAIAWRRTTRNPEAYDLFQRARSLYFNAINRQGWVQAKTLLEQAIRADGAFSTGYAFLAQLYLIGPVDEAPAETEAALARAFACARKALQVDSANPAAHCALCLYWLFKREHDKSHEALQQALARAPYSGDVRFFLALLHLFDGKPAVAIATVQEAMRMVPQPPPLYGLILGMAALLMGNFAETLIVLQKMAEIGSESPWPRIYLAAAYGALGRMEEAKQAAQDVLRLAPNFRLDVWSARRLAFRNPADEERVVALLRNAGLS